MGEIEDFTIFRGKIRYSRYSLSNTNNKWTVRCILSNENYNKIFIFLRSKITMS